MLIVYCTHKTSMIRQWKHPNKNTYRRKEKGALNQAIKGRGGDGWRCNHRMALPHQREMVTWRKRCLVQLGPSEEVALCPLP